MSSYVRKIMAGVGVLGATTGILFAATGPAFAQDNVGQTPEKGVVKLCSDSEFARLTVRDGNGVDQGAVEVQPNGTSITCQKVPNVPADLSQAILVVDAGDPSGTPGVGAAGIKTGVDVADGLTVTVTSTTGGDRLVLLTDGANGQAGPVRF
jgi:hypothetical protein